jgi:hypothetical protein
VEATDTTRAGAANFGRCHPCKIRPAGGGHDHLIMLGLVVLIPLFLAAVVAGVEALALVLAIALGTLLVLALVSAWRPGRRH